ncbi:hypothetical protein N0V90_007247 [Kalmusia sp. IMI 367209]|nr:hypothetical protein N0V90_007247 [Kalmusia sp. IMI 367209]
MPKTIGYRRGRFTGPYRFAPSEPPGDCSDALVPAHVAANVTAKKSKPRIKEHEMDFLVNWLDFCLMEEEEDLFQETLVKEFQKRFGRVVNAKTAETKVIGFYQELAGQTGSKSWDCRFLLSQVDEGELLRKGQLQASEPQPQLELNSKPRLLSSVQPSQIRPQLSPVVENDTLSKTRKSKTSVTSSVLAPVRVGSEGYESAVEIHDTSETDSTVVPRLSDISQPHWQPIKEQRGGAKGPRSDARDRKISMLSNMVSWLLDRHRHGWIGSEAEVARLESIRKEVVSDRDHVFASLLSELTGEEKKTAKYQSIIKSVVGSVSIIQPEVVNTPQAPSPKAIDREWMLLRERCRLLTQTIQVDRKFASQNFQRLYESIDVTWGSEPHYKAVIHQSAQLHAVHEDDVLVKLYGSMARLLFIFVFEYPSPLLQDQHSDLLKHLYTMIGAAGNMSEVKRLDLLATEMLVKEDRIQNGLIQQKAEQRMAWISQMLGLTEPQNPYDTVVRDLRELCYRAIKLFAQLLVSPLGYCIHFFPCGTLFDEPSMKAEDVSGTSFASSHCIGKEVKLCLFPAIWQYCDQPLDETRDIPDALTASKKFLWTHMSEMNVHLSLVSKAVVLLE